MNVKARPLAFAALTLLFTLALFSHLVVAQQGDSVDVRVAEHETLGAYLTDSQGNALYLFNNDAPYTSNCTGGCAQNWPPLTIDGAPRAGEGVDIVHLGTIQREDGSRQVTYAGWPLYTFARDEDAGDVSGQGANDSWFLVSPQGEPIGAEGGAEEQAAAEADDAAGGDAEAEDAEETAAEGEVSAEVMAAGEEIYAQNCASCHGGRGRGVVGPALANNQALANEAAVARQIVHGRDEMPPFGGILDDEQIAAVGTYVRNTWGNDFGPLTEEQVAEQR